MVDISWQSFVVFVLLCTATGFAVAADAGELTEHSSQKLTMHFAGPGAHTLEVRTIEGNITVQAYDGADVEMTVDRSLSAENEADMRAAHRDVALDTADGAATIHAIVRYPNQQTCGGTNGDTSRPGYHVRFDFTIRVPRAVRLQLCAINSGIVLVSGTAGDFDVSNVNGRITMNAVAGSGKAMTVNGAVTASFVTAPQRSSTFRTINGDVAITLPGISSANFHMKTFNGHVISDFAAKPMAGNGGPDLTLESLNGDVRVLRQAK
jgi:DUF4097 and DUF4098 domain-containing protein YvlB